MTRHGTHLIAKGFSQRLGVDYNETFAPVANFSTPGFLLALAANEELELLQLHVKAAFLNGNLDEVIYMTQPEEFVNEQRSDSV